MSPAETASALTLASAETGGAIMSADSAVGAAASMAAASPQSSVASAADLASISVQTEVISEAAQIPPELLAAASSDMLPAEQIAVRVETSEG